MPLSVYFAPDKKSGLTIAEMLITLSLSAFIVISLFMVWSKVNAIGTSLSLRDRQLLEIQTLFFNLRNVIKNSSVDAGSLSRQLVLDGYDSTGLPYLQGYRINNPSAGVYNLQLSTNLLSPNDGTASWDSPYNITNAADYQLPSNAEFVYCGYANNCTEFLDTNGNNIFDAGVDTAQLAGGYSGTALSNPSQARRVALLNFTFNRNYGNPPVIQTMPTTYIRVAPRIVDPGPPQNWGTSPLVQNFSTTNASNPSFSTGFTPYGAFYENQHKRLLIVGQASSGNSVFLVDSHGSTIRDTSNTINGTATSIALSPALASTFRILGTAMETDGVTALILALDTTNTKNYLYRVNLSSGTYTTLDFSNAAFSFLSNGKVYGIAYDPAISADVFIVAKNSGNTALKLYEINKLTPAAAVNTYSLPAGLTSPTALFMEPLDGYFYILQNTITTSGSDKTIAVYKIDRASSSTTNTFSINLAKITGATSTGTNNYGFAYNFENNHVFLVDTTANKVFEIVPAALISRRS